MTTPYTTLAKVRSELKASSTVDDGDVMPLIRQVSARIDSVMGQPDYFAPYIEARYFPLVPTRVQSYSNLFRLHDNLLVLSAVSIEGTSYTVGTQVSAYPPGRTPARSLQMLASAGSWYEACSSGVLNPQVLVTGVWGYRTRYTVEAWLAVDALAAGINASVTSLTVADVDGADAWGYTPRISAGNLLKIDDELMLATATNTSTNAIPVRRGVNGSTAAAHLIGATVSVFQVEDTIARAATRQAALLYARRGAFEASQMTDVGIVTYPSDLLNELYASLRELAYSEGA